MYWLDKQLIDIARFHAWQSSLVFTFLFIIHIIFSWSSILSWLIFAGDLCLIGWLAFKAYGDGKSHVISKDLITNFRSATTLDRYEVPFFGPLASSILDDE